MDVNLATPLEPLRNASESYAPEELSRSHVWCRKTARTLARNFYYSFLTLSGPKFRGMCALYAFLRVTDDLGDNPAVPLEERELQLRNWNRELQQLTTSTLR